MNIWRNNWCYQDSTNNTKISWIKTVVKNWNSNLEWTLVIENLSRKMVVVFFNKWDQFHWHVKDKVHCTIVLNLNSKRMDKVASMTSSASFHQKNYWAWFFHQPWHQNDLFWSDNVGWIIINLLSIFIFDTLSLRGCGGQGCYF